MRRFPILVGVAAFFMIGATAGLLLLQMVAAVAGAWLADRRALRGADMPGERLG